MDLLQLVISALSILAVAGIAAWLYPNKLKLDSENVAKDYRRFNPEATIGSPLVTTKGNGAIIPVKAPTGQLGIVTQLGDRLVCRTLLSTDRYETNHNGDMLIIRLADFTQPAIKLNFGPETMTKVLSLFAIHAPNTKYSASADTSFATDKDVTDAS
ncbi:MAG: hypothetical protein COB37_08260 [Kordiimonadales bacterium]|nr:MAG: hypothetical protein COB37_08260 [Kordiimonadales bacterium]